jgi:hypothetical protein
MNDKTSCSGLFLFLLQHAKKTCVFRFLLLSEVLAGVNIARNLKCQKSINNFEHTDTSSTCEMLMASFLFDTANTLHFARD